MNLVKTVATFGFVIVSTASAFAADLPSKKEPVIIQIVEDRKPFFVGLRGGWASNNGWNAGVNGGWEFSKFARVEANYDYIQAQGVNSNIISGNGILQYPTSFKVTPYVLGGFGYRFGNMYNNVWNLPYGQSVGFNKNFGEAIWNVGAGARYEFVKNLELDVRYRYLQGFATQKYNHIVTAGIDYRF